MTLQVIFVGVGIAGIRPDLFRERTANGHRFTYAAMTRGGKSQDGSGFKSIGDTEDLELIIETWTNDSDNECR